MATINEIRFPVCECCKCSFCQPSNFSNNGNEVCDCDVKCEGICKNFLQREMTITIEPGEAIDTGVARRLESEYAELIENLQIFNDLARPFELTRPWEELDDDEKAAVHVLQQEVKCFQRMVNKMQFWNVSTQSMFFRHLRKTMMDNYFGIPYFEAMRIDFPLVEALVEAIEKRRVQIADYYEQERTISCIVTGGRRMIPRAESGVDEQNIKTEEENVVFTDQRETVDDEGYITSQTLTTMTTASMPQDIWSVAEVMKKPVPFLTLDWTTSDDVGSVLSNLNVPGDTLKGPHYNLCATFTFFRAHPKIRIQVNGTKFHSGRLIACFLPLTLSPVTTARLNVDALLSLPHVILDASLANSGILELPFTHINTYFNTFKNDDQFKLGNLLIIPFNKLRAATGTSTSIGVTCWISYENAELHQPSWAHTVALPKETALAESGVEGFIKSAISTVDRLATPVMDVASGAMNMDKPTDPIEISRWVPNAVTGLSHGDGLDRSQRLSLLPGTYTVPDPTILSTTEDDMNLLNLCKIPTRIKTATWTDALTTKTLIATIPVYPTLYTQRSVAANHFDLRPSLIGYISRGFKFWRGSLRYKIQVIASQMHSGRIAICYMAGFNSQTDFDSNSYTNMVIMDLQERHEIEIVTPFLAERPYLRSDRFENVDNTGGTGNFDKLGALRIFVLNRLTHPDSVATDVDINVLVSAGDDFELSVPADLSDFRSSTQVFGPVAESQTTVTTRTEQNPIIMGKGSGLISKESRFLQSENAMRLPTLLRRYNLVRQWKSQALLKTANRAMVTWYNCPWLGSRNNPFDSTGGSPAFYEYPSTLDHYSRLFTFWRGSLRYKIVLDQAHLYNAEQGTITVTAYHIPGNVLTRTGKDVPLQDNCNMSTIMQSMTPLGVAVLGSGVQASLEIEVPFYSPYLELLTVQGNAPVLTSVTGSIVLWIESADKIDDYIGIRVYQAAGDDYQLNYLRTPPIVHVAKMVEQSQANDAEYYRLVGDNEVGVYQGTPDMCSRPTLTEKRQRKTETETLKPIAEGLSDYVPIYGQYKRTAHAVEEASHNLGQVCKTADQVLRSTVNRIGLNGIDGDDETGEETPANLVDTAEATMTAVIAAVESFVSKLDEHMRPQNFHIAEFVVDVATYLSGLEALNSDSMVIKAAGLTAVVTLFLRKVGMVVKDKLFGFVTAIVRSWYGGREGNEPPSAEAHALDLIAPLGATLCSMMTVMGLSRIPTDKESSEMCRGISERLRLFNFSTLALTNLKSLWNQVSEVLSWVTEYVLKKLSPLMFARLKLEKDFADVEQWAAFIDSLETIPYADRIHYDLEFRNRLYRCVDAGKRFNDLLLMGKIGREATLIREYVRKIFEIGHKCETSKNNLPFRRDPFCITLTGNTGIGKSGCITNLAFDIMDRLDYPRHNRWCPINCGEDFFSENYFQQFAVYFDDFGAIQDEQQYKNFFNLKANTAYPLNMAFRKGEYFNSDFIFVTTNTSYPRPNFLAHPQAFLRRRDMLLEVDWIDDPDIRATIANGGRMHGFRRLDHSHLRFRWKHSERPNTFFSDWMTYEETLALCTQEARAHLNTQQEMLTRNLARAGYINPVGEAGMKVLDVDKLREHPLLRYTDAEALSQLVWDPVAQVYGLPEDDYVCGEYEAAMRFFHTESEMRGESELQRALILCEKELGLLPTVIARMKERMSKLKNWLRQEYQRVCEAYPWVSKCIQWTPVVLAGFLGYAMTRKLVTIAPCVCTQIKNFGYRCAVCGVWPRLVNIAEAQKNFVLSAWRRMFGTATYTPGTVTSLAEENVFNTACTGALAELVRPTLGTQAEACGPYLEMTRGQTAQRIVANSSANISPQPGMPPSRPVAQSNTQTLATTRILPYLYRLQFDGGAVAPCNAITCFALGDRKVIVNSHFFLNMQEGEHFKIFHSGCWLPVEFVKEKMTVIPNKDLVIYDMPIQFHAHKDNTKHLISEKDLPYFQSGKGVLCKLTPQGNWVQIEDLDVVSMKKLEFEAIQGLTKYPLYVQDAWAYRKCSSLGDCGSPLLTYSDRVSGKILGFHCASDPVRSYAQLVTREMVQGLVKRVEGTPIPQAEGKMGNIVPEGHFGRIGKTAKGSGFFQSPKTEIIPTRIHGHLSEPVTFPSVLSKWDERLEKRVEPLQLGIAKYGTCVKPFPLSDRVIVNNFFFDEVRGFRPPRRACPLSIFEGCNGIAGLDGYERLPRSTSPGWPWVNERPRGAKGKDFLFDGDEPLPIFVAAIERRAGMARVGERIESVWIDCLKDERRSWDKIIAGKTRVFTIPPADFSVLLRIEALDYAAAIQQYREESSCKVGIDPQSLEWSTLYYWLSVFASKFVAGDFKNFDGTMHGDIMDDVRREIDVFYQEHGECSAEDVKIREILFDELVHTVHLAKDEFYMTHMGNPSGNPLTTKLNSRYHARLIALAWLGLARKYCPDFATMSHFSQNVRMCLYGDDGILAIKDEVIEWFNQETIADYLLEYGITYTNDEKNGVTKWKTLEECTFLKQGFGRHQDLSTIVVPLMKESTIMELLNWTRIAPDQDELLQDNCTDALRFAYFYGKEYFNSLRDRIVCALQSEGIWWRPMLYDDYHYWFLGVINAR